MKLLQNSEIFQTMLWCILSNFETPMTLNSNKPWCHNSEPQVELKYIITGYIAIPKQRSEQTKSSDDDNFVKQECIPVGCVPPAY